MNVSILGMQGAGKTVFITRLIDFIRKRYGWEAVSGDLESERYCADILDTLSGNKTGTPSWPESTKQGNPQCLKFRCHIKEDRIKITLWDVAGQDIEELFSENAPSTQIQKQIASQLQASQLLIFLFDLSAFNPQLPYSTQVVNRFIYKRFKNYCQEYNIPGLLVLSKADEYQDLEMYDGELLQEYVESHCDLKLPPYLKLCAIAPVITETVIADNNIPCRVPQLRNNGKSEIQSLGMEKCLDLILSVATVKKNPSKKTDNENIGCVIQIISIILSVGICGLCVMTLGRIGIGIGIIVSVGITILLWKIFGD